MSIQFTEKSYILGIWYQESEDCLINYLTAFWKEDGKWIGRRRKRIVRDGDSDPFNDNDEKIWESLTPKNPHITEGEIMDMMDHMTGAAKICGLKTDQLLIQGDFHKFIEMAKTKPWMHMKEERIH